MSQYTFSLTEPIKLIPDPALGVLRGGNGRYEKKLRDLSGLYRDEATFRRLAAKDGDSLAYWVESSNVQDGPGGLISGLSVLQPGQVGEEFFMTRGHLHRKSECAELYVGVAGTGVMLLDSIEGESRAIQFGPGEAVSVPGGWVHRSVNVGPTRMASLFCYANDAGQDYELIARAGGMRQLVVVDGAGWTTQPNPSHVGYTRGA
jgi:glucose-6-phosphate isomerase